MKSAGSVKTFTNLSFLNEVERVSGALVSSCFQCKKCTSGCPVSFAMDFVPHRILHMIHMGLKEEVLMSSAIWICTGCEACYTRCPNEINIPRIIDTLRQTAKKSPVILKEKRIPVFNETFLKTIKKRGRVHEFEMIQKYFIKSGSFFEKLRKGELVIEIKLAWEMFKRGKLGLPAEDIKRKEEFKIIFNASEKSRL